MYKLLSLIPSPSPMPDPDRIHIPGSVAKGIIIACIAVIIIAALTSGGSKDS